jgi:hypothetical protein
MQVAALRIGRTVGGPEESKFTDMSDADVSDVHSSFHRLLIDSQVKLALTTPFPSELLLKGIVASELREMENNLEEKVVITLSVNNGRVRI